MDFNDKAEVFITMPGAFGSYHETGKKVHYPIFAFTSRQKGKELMQAIKTKAKEYIQKHLLKAKEEQTKRVRN